MHIVVSLMILFVQFLSANFSHVDNLDNSEELIYNGVVYFDDDMDSENVTADLSLDGWDLDQTVSQDNSVSQIVKKDNNPPKDNNIDNNKTQTVYEDNIDEWKNLDDEEEEIIFHDDFDTWYWDELEEIWDE